MSDDKKKEEQGQKIQEETVGGAVQPQTEAPLNTAEQEQKTQGMEDSPEAEASSNTKGKYTYTEAEETFSPSKNATTTIKVQRSVDRVDEDNPIISTTIKEETQAKRAESRKTTVEIDKYSMASGLTSKTETFENSSTYDRKGRVREGSFRHSQETTSEGNGAIGISSGEKSSYSFSNETTEQYKYNKDGTIKSSHIHHEVTGSHPSVSDESTVLKRDEVKENMRVEASRAGAKIKAIKKNKEFSGDVSANGSEHYLFSKGKKITEVSVNAAGEVSGFKATLDKSEENIAKKKELSRRELKSALKKMRREADNAVKAASGMKRVQDYMSQVPQASGENLKFVWDVDPNAINNAKPKVTEAQKEWVNKHAPVNATVILAQVKNNQRR